MFGENEKRKERYLRVTIAVMKHDDQKQVGENSLAYNFWLTLVHHSASLKEVINKTVKEAGDGS